MYVGKNKSEFEMIKAFKGLSHIKHSEKRDLRIRKKIMLIILRSKRL